MLAGDVIVSIKECLYAAICYLLTWYQEQDCAYGLEGREEVEIHCNT